MTGPGQRKANTDAEFVLERLKRQAVEIRAVAEAEIAKIQLVYRRQLTPTTCQNCGAPTWVRREAP